jgi:hypothetical protein
MLKIRLSWKNTYGYDKERAWSKIVMFLFMCLLLLVCFSGYRCG